VPDVVITTQGSDVQLDWNAIELSVGECPVEVTEYLVFFSEQMAGPFWYHGHTADTTYIHSGAVAHASGMYYHVIASTAPLILMDNLLSDGSEPVTEDIVLETLLQSGHRVVR